MEVETRWDSTYDMMARLVQLEWSVRRVISNREIVPLSDARHLEMTDDSWKLIKDLLPLLKHPFLITKMIQSQNYPSILLSYPSLYVLYEKFNADQSTNPACLEFKQKIKSKLDAAYYQPGYHLSLPMLASAIDPRFKHLSFIPASLLHETYRALKEKIVRWKIDRLPQPSAAATVNSSPTTSSTSISIDVDAPSTSTTMFSMFDCLTSGAPNVNTIGDYERVTSEINAQFGHFLNEPLAGSDTNPLEW